MRGILFIAITLGVLSSALTYTQNPHITISEMKTGSPFDLALQKKTLRAVLHFYNIPMNEEFDAPRVLISQDLSDEHLIAEVESQGVNRKFLKRGINIYLLDSNVIVLTDKAKIHNLAHEYSHFVQHKYQGYDRSDLKGDDLEEDAIGTQDFFREPRSY